MWKRIKSWWLQALIGEECSQHPGHRVREFNAGYFDCGEWVYAPTCIACAVDQLQVKP